MKSRSESPSTDRMRRRRAEKEESCGYQADDTPHFAGSRAALELFASVPERPDRHVSADPESGDWGAGRTRSDTLVTARKAQIGCSLDGSARARALRRGTTGSERPASALSSPHDHHRRRSAATLLRHLRHHVPNLQISTAEAKADT